MFREAAQDGMFGSVLHLLAPTAGSLKLSNTAYFFPSLPLKVLYEAISLLSSPF